MNEADPFGEFEQVEEKKLEGGAAPQAVAKFFEEEQKKVFKADNFSDLKHNFPVNVREQAEQHFLQRQRYYSRIRAKEEEIEAIMERLYLVRHQSNISESVITDCKNLLAELNRLQEELATIRERGLQKFCATLELDEIGISKRTKTASFRNPSKVDLASPPRTMSSINSGPGAYEYSNVGTKGFMRTGTTASFSAQPPNKKWQSLFNMYKEWRFQKQIAEAQRMVQEGRMPAPTAEAGVVLLNEEKNKLRAAIYTLRQRKDRSEADENLLHVLQRKLQALNTIPQEHLATPN